MKTRALSLSLFLLVCPACGSDDDGGSNGSSGSGGSSGASSGGSGGGGAVSGSGGGAGTGAAGSGGVSGSSGSSGAAGTSGSAGSGGSGSDADGDGLDDGQELALATAHFPYYSVAPNDNCPRHGVLFRAAPHPDDATKIMIWYVVLFENDCGANGHVGDDEVFGVVIDPSLPLPQSLLAVRAISHQGTFCEAASTCGSLSGCDACTTADKNGVNLPVVFPSVNKHGQYVKESTCDASIVCDFGGCTLNPSPSAPALVNAGEPGMPLVTNLTSQGFINAANGWTEAQLMDFDPWSNQDFGGAGNVTSDLTDSAFVVSLSGCN